VTQTLRPDSTVSSSNVTGGFADIDEATASDVDYVWSTNNTVGAITVGLTNPAATPGAGSTAVRYRIAKTNVGTVSGTGAIVDVTVSLYEGATLRDTDTTRTATGTWTTYTWAPDTSAVSNWSNLRLVFSFSKSGATDPRGAAVSWAELEAPAPAYRLTLTSRSYSTTFQDVTLRAPKSLAVASASFSVTASAVSFRYNRAISLTSATFGLTLTDPTLHLGYSLGIESAEYVVTMNAGTPINVDSAAYALTLADIGFRYNRVFPIASASFSLTAADATLAKGYFVEIANLAVVITMADIQMSVREPNGWNIPKYPQLDWSEAGGGSGGWQELPEPSGDWSQAA
jgi:hypothetical protein